MRGYDSQQSAAFSYLSPEERVPANHPLRPIREMIDVALAALSAVFSQIYATTGLWVIKMPFAKRIKRLRGGSFLAHGQTPFN